jgi:hypothetical protein
VKLALRLAERNSAKLTNRSVVKSTRGLGRTSPCRQWRSVEEGDPLARAVLRVKFFLMNKLGQSNKWSSCNGRLGSSISAGYRND